MSISPQHNLSIQRAIDSISYSSLPATECGWETPFRIESSTFPDQLCRPSDAQAIVKEMKN